MKLSSCNYLSFFLFLFSFFVLQAQGETGEVEYVNFPVRIDSVLIVGNDKTDDAVITREIPFDLPAEFTLEDVQQIQNRLTNLFLFNRVMISVINDGLKNLLNIEVSEIYYIYPVPILFRQDRTWDRISYGFQVAHYNFRGKHEYLSIGGWAGFNPAFFIRYSNPWVTRARYTLGMSFFWRKTRNSFIETLNPEQSPITQSQADFYESNYGGFSVDARQLALGLTIGKRLGYFTRINLNADIRRLRYDDDLPEAFEAFRGFNIFPKLSVEFRDDRRDLFEYPREGHYARWVVTRSGFTRAQPQYWRLHLDHRKYLKLSQWLTIAARNMTTLTSEEPPVYDWTLIGYGERVRGYYFDRFNGQNRMTNSVEARIRLLNDRYVSWEEAPIFRKFFQQLKYGASLALFADNGTLWGARYRLSGEELIRSEPPLALSNFFSGYGVGLHLHLPYVYLLRLEQSWSDQGNPQFVLEAEVTF